MKTFNSIKQVIFFCIHIFQLGLFKIKKIESIKRTFAYLLSTFILFLKASFMWRSFSTCSTSFKEVSKVKEVNSQVVINEVMKTFISPYKAGCVSRANSLFASSRAHEKSMVELFVEECSTTVRKILHRYFLSLIYLVKPKE